MTMPKVEGWLLNPETQWAYRFHRDEKSWVHDPKVFLDKGKQFGKEEAPLLVTRQHLRRERAEELWKLLRSQGWQQSEPLWGRYADV